MLDPNNKGLDVGSNIANGIRSVVDPDLPDLPALPLPEGSPPRRPSEPESIATLFKEQVMREPSAMTSPGSGLAGHGGGPSGGAGANATFDSANLSSFDSSALIPMDLDTAMSPMTEMEAQLDLMRGAETLLRQHPTSLRYDLWVLGLRRTPYRDAMPAHTAEATGGGVPGLPMRPPPTAEELNFHPDSPRPILSYRARTAIVERVEVKRVLHSILLDCMQVCSRYRGRGGKRRERVQRGGREEGGERDSALLPIAPHCLRRDPLVLIRWN